MTRNKTFCCCRGGVLNIARDQLFISIKPLSLKGLLKMPVYGTEMHGGQDGLFIRRQLADKAHFVAVSLLA